jgi:hypothetical protein
MPLADAATGTEAGAATGWDAATGAGAGGGAGGIEIGFSQLDKHHASPPNITPLTTTPSRHIMTTPPISLKATAAAPARQRIKPGFT